MHRCGDIRSTQCRWRPPLVPAPLVRAFRSRDSFARQGVRPHRCICEIEHEAREVALDTLRCLLELRLEGFGGELERLRADGCDDQEGQEADSERDPAASMGPRVL